MTDWYKERFEGLDPRSDRYASTGVGPRTSRKRLILALAAAATLLAVLAVAVIVTVSRGREDAGRSAGDAVKRYLEALARGDAATALSYGIDQPATKEFLAAATLNTQVAHWPIRHIQIMHDNSSEPGTALSMAHVHAVASFGDQTSDAVLNVRMDHNHWKLPAAAIKFFPGFGASMGNAAAKTITLFGRPIGDATVYVFPGWIDIGTVNPYVSVTVPPLLLDQLTMAAPYWVYPTFALADRGRDAVSAQLAVAMGSCQESSLLAPPGCPVRVDSYGMAEGTAVWGTADLSAIRLDRFDPYHLTQAFSGQVRVPVTVKTPDGVTRQEDVTEFLSGSADLATTPPQLTFH
ncbi:hypothetical protein BRW65_02035 [Mycobacterium paraffinicum]|uniref:Uncharacterized protein n=1 Tax=Mycobacterium paraffinicum TaxID=53378 RepID=A0A1Q4I2L5_9MYCO|nr:DUF4878 domain-containing protein [Mycobacterium paraffinicum]OJZ76224.1 hypothetical protein BRW65_02035 [Mycobacterium paraffinicum]